MNLLVVLIGLCFFLSFEYKCLIYGFFFLYIIKCLLIFLVIYIYIYSASAFFVTQTLRGLSRDGRTVIASIHQPSSEVFELFDQLYLLSGGQTVYFGKASEAYEVKKIH